MLRSLMAFLIVELGLIVLSLYNLVKMFPLLPRE